MLISAARRKPFYYILHESFAQYVLLVFSLDAFATEARLC